MLSQTAAGLTLTPGLHTEVALPLAAIMQAASARGCVDLPCLLPDPCLPHFVTEAALLDLWPWHSDFWVFIQHLYNLSFASLVRLLKISVLLITCLFAIFVCMPLCWKPQGLT